MTEPTPDATASATAAPTGTPEVLEETRPRVPFLTPSGIPPIIWMGLSHPVQVKHEPPIDPDAHTHEELALLHRENHGVVPGYDPMEDSKEMLAQRLSDRKVRTVLDGPHRETVHRCSPDHTLSEEVHYMTSADGMWKDISGHPAPTWVEGEEDDELTNLLVANLRQHWREQGYDVPVGKPEDWEGMHHAHARQQVADFRDSLTSKEV